MDGEYRNHPVVLLKNALICFVMVFILWVAGFRDSKEAFASVTILAAVAWSVSFLLWRRTKVSFEYTEIRYRRDTILSRTEKTIPYSRLASVGVRRSVIDLIEAGRTEESRFHRHRIAHPVQTIIAIRSMSPTLRF